MTALGLTASNGSRLDALRAKHHSLNLKIEEEQRSPSVADFYLHQLKKKKLLLKEEIEGIRHNSANA